jgi:hypothetical protein
VACPDFTFIRGSKTENRLIRQRIYTYRELAEQLAVAGFEAVEGYGGLDQEPFRLGSQRLIIGAKKAGKS